MCPLNIYNYLHFNEYHSVLLEFSPLKKKLPDACTVANYLLCVSKIKWVTSTGFI